MRKTPASMAAVLAGAVLVFGARLPARGDQPERPSTAQGSLPSDSKARALNLDFEAGDLRDWKAEGDAFKGQPIEGDLVFSRRSDTHSRHQGKFWAGSFERAGDRPHGTLTSSPFRIDKPFARFLIAGGSRNTTRFEIVELVSKKVIYQTSGDDTEELKPVAVDLTAHVGKDVFLRLIDQDSDGWGHINFDDFRLHSTRPPSPIRPSSAAADVFAHDGLSPSDAAKAMTVPEGFKVTLFAGEPDIVQPIAFAIDDRGRLWVAEAYSYPVRVPEAEAKDRILIFEDKNNDGVFDSRKIFADKLNLVSGLELGFGGVWVGAAPNLLFIPDRDGDDRPDGPPQILLDGWGYHDTHETLNSFNWGPDGWLYGCHGVFTHSRLGKPGTPDKDRVPLNAGIWRYHPTRHVFEVFANGTSNPWGVDFDAHGQAFLTSCVIPHLYHVIQGARYERQAGPHFNNYTYDDIKTIADHRHYVGANPHAGNGRSEEAGGGHAHSGALIYLGGSWPKEYQGSIFMNNIHGARLNRDTLQPQGSGFIGHHAPDFLKANDRWSQVVSLKTGPDGNMYFIDWYDKNQCHRNEVAAHDRTNGRIFKVSYGADSAAKTFNISSTDPQSIAKLLSGDNEWFARHTRRHLQERAPLLTKPEKQALLEPLRKLSFEAQNERVRLNGLWAIHALGGLDGSTLNKALDDANPYHRAWAIQLSCEQGPPSPPLLRRFAELSKTDPSPVVRLYLASALQRLPSESRWDILQELISHAEDANDHNLPLMAWYALEPLAEVDASRALKLAEAAKLPNLLEFMVRRVSGLGTPEAVALLVESIHRSHSDIVRLKVLQALNESLKGRRKVAMPSSWPEIFSTLQKSPLDKLRSEATALALTFGNSSALKTLRSTLSDRTLETSRRSDALTALLKARDPELPSEIRSLLDDPTIRGQAIRALAAYEDPKAAAALLSAYATLRPEERRDALNTLAARLDSARALLAAVGKNQISSKDLSADVIRQLRNLKKPEIDADITKHWGSVRDSSNERLARIAKYRDLLKTSSSGKADPELGRTLFVKTCQQCHTLFGVGGKVGPELTGSNRADLEYVLSNVLDPSALIGKDYIAHIVSTTDGRVLTGVVKAEDKDALTLQTANEIVVIPNNEVEERKPSSQSMMPEDLWSPLSDHDVRSLVAYLASPAQVPSRATPENVSDFFNGRDLKGWVGDASLWSVEAGEIVGKTSGLARNAFLRSEISAGDFRLTLQVKLTANRGNSGVQFHSAPLPDGEMKGDQADIGPGWWGKLYEENGRGLLWDKSGEAHVLEGDWNTYEIVAVGPLIRTWINGKPCVSLDDPSGARRGIFALQLHSGEATEVRFKNLRLELDPRLDH